MGVLEVEPNEGACKQASDDDEHHHGDVEPEIDHVERDPDDGAILRHFPTLPDHFVRAAGDGAAAAAAAAAGRRRDPRQVVRPLVVERHHLVLSSLQLLQLGPRDSVSGVLVEGHRPGDPVELELAKLVEDQLRNVAILVVVILQTLASGFQFANRLV